MKLNALPLLVAFLFLGCTRSSTDKQEVARFFLNEVPPGVELVKGEFHYIRHPDSHKFGFLDMRMGEKEYLQIADYHGMKPESPTRLASVVWPADLQPMSLNHIKVFANPVMVMICASNSNRVVVLSMAQFPGWYDKP